MSKPRDITSNNDDDPRLATPLVRKYQRFTPTLPAGEDIKFTQYGSDEIHRTILPEKLQANVQLGNEHIPWTRPSSPLPIDNQIYYLINPTKRIGKKSSAGAKISQDYMRVRYPNQCPYVVARDGIVFAIECANKYVEAEYFVRYPLANNAKNLTKTIKKVRKAVNELNDCLMPFRSLKECYQISLRRQFDMQPDIADLLLLLATSDSLERIEKNFDRVAKACKSGKPGKLWDNIFAEIVGALWFSLTGSLPGFDNNFIAFLKSAFNTIYKSEGVDEDVTDETRWRPHVDRCRKFVLDKIETVEAEGR